MNNLVSVIIPCFNSASTIERCINSVFSQKYSALEIICINDGSSDNTLSLLEKLKINSPFPFQIINVQNQGASNARNQGIRISIGDYIQFLDADDFLNPTKILVQIGLTDNSKVDLVVGNYIVEDLEKSEKIYQINNHWEAIIKGRLGFTSSNLWRKVCVIKSGEWDNVKSSQDYCLLFKMLKQNVSLVFDQNFNTIKHEQSANSITYTNRKENIIRYIELRIQIWDFLELNNLLNQHLLETLQINIFDSIRILYQVDSKSGNELFFKHVLNKYSPIKSNSTSGIYLFFYSIFGFKFTQKIYSFIK